MAATHDNIDKHTDLEDATDLGRKESAVQVPIYNQLELVSETDLSFAAILKGTAARPLNTFEKKAALINHELDQFGLGRYQICIWFLCGFGYFLDLAWSQGVGLIASAVYQEMGVPDSDTGNIFAIANAGLAVGALGFGLAVDVIGRKWAFNLTCLITSIFGLLLAAPKYNYGAICGIYFLARSAWEATSPSMPPSPSSICLRIAASWWPFSPCGSLSASPWLRVSRMAPQQSGVATPNCPLARRWEPGRRAAPLGATWAGATTSSFSVP